MRKFRLAFGLVILLCTARSPSLVASGNSVSKTTFLAATNPIDDVINARLAGGLIMVQARLNGQIGNYILDTGASHLFINQDLVNEKTVHAYGVGNPTAVQTGQVQRFEIGTVTFFDQPIYKMDMRHLEAIKGCQIAGIIGTNLLSSFSLFVDYKNGIVQLTRADQPDIQTSLTVLRTHPFKMQGHFPMLSVSVNEISYEFALDTGAEANIFSEKFENELSLKTENLQSGKVWSIGASTTQVRNFTLTEMKCLDLDYHSMGFMFSNLATLNHSYAVKLDGILGYPFLRRHPFTIDFNKKELTFWENENLTTHK